MNTKIQNLRLEWRSPDELADNPANWREHPKEQLLGLESVINEVGWAGAVLYNEKTGRLIDGHARKKLSIDGEIPVLVGSWSEEQEELILATLDPLGAMANANQDALQSLLSAIQSTPDVQELLESIAIREGIDDGEWKGRTLDVDAIEDYKLIVETVSVRVDSVTVNDKEVVVALIESILDEAELVYEVRVY